MDPLLTLLCTLKKVLFGFNPDLEPRFGQGEITAEKLKQPITIREIAFMDDPRIIIIPLYLDPKELIKTTTLNFFGS